MRILSRSIDMAGMALLFAAVGCGTSGDDDSAANQSGTGGNGCVGSCPSSASGGMTGSGGGGSSGSAGQLAGSGGRGTGGGGGANAGSGGALGTGGALGGEDAGLVVILTGTCPKLSEVVSAGTAAPGFATLYEDPDIFSSTDNIALSADDVYFTAKEQLARVPKAGGTTEMLGTTRVSSLTVTATDVIWAEQKPDNTYHIVKRPLGSSAEPVELVKDLMNGPKGLTVDGSSLDWIGTGPGVSQVALSGGAVTVLGETVSADDFALLGGELYILNSASLMHVPTGGAAPMMVAQFFFGGEIASDMSNIFMADSSEGTLKKWSPGTTEPETVAQKSDGFASMDTLFARDGMVYWAEDMPCDQVFRAGADGSGHTKLMDGFQRISDIVVDDSAIYVTDQHGLYRMDR